MQDRRCWRNIRTGQLIIVEFLYFAYGSNMDPMQIRRRCPSARFVSVARLDNYHLAFTRRSPRRRCGVADVVADHGSEVWGVVYRITASRDMLALDSAEGFRKDRKRGNSYSRRLKRIEFNGSRAMAQYVHIYLAHAQPYPPRPSANYIGHLRRGAEHWGLPGDYQIKLSQIQTLT